jgi:hypothetical protein
MKRLLDVMAVAALLLSATAARATPSTVVWSPATTYTQPYLVPHVTYDTYFGERNGFSTDVGLTMGFVPDNKFIEGEIGFDGFYPMLAPTPTGNDAGKFQTRNAFQFNGKLSLKEGSLSEYAPALSVGIMNAGLTKNLNNFNIAYAVLGKTLGAYGTVGLGAYSGNNKLLVDFKQDGTFKKDETGLLASYTSPKWAVGALGLKDISFALDYMSGNNAFGAGAVGAIFNFNDAIDVITGPVLFNNKYSATTSAPPFSQTNFLWTVQLDVDIDFAKPKPAPKA